MARRLPLVVLAIAAACTLIGCDRADHLSGGRQENALQVQAKVGPEPVRCEKLHDSYFRMRLLRLETVQKSLELTPDQTRQIGELFQVREAQGREFLAKSREILPESQPFSPEEYQAREQESHALQDDFTRTSEELRTRSLQILTSSQMDRLKQVEIQAAVPAALTSPEIIKTLNITEKQIARIRALCNRSDEKTAAELHALADLGPGERDQKMIAYAKKYWSEGRAEMARSVLEVLTPEQRTKFEELQGEKIEVPWPFDAVIPQDTGL